jgi:hypothetical protein
VVIDGLATHPAIERDWYHVYESDQSCGPRSAIRCSETFLITRMLTCASRIRCDLGALFKNLDSDDELLSHL